MNWDAPTIVALVAALGLGGALQALVGWFKDRKKDSSEANRTDVETKLAYVNGVIERLEDENKRILAREQRTSEELALEQERSAKLRARVRELEDELDGVRRSARETQVKCEVLAERLKELVDEQDDAV